MSKDTNIEENGIFSYNSDSMERDKSTKIGLYKDRTTGRLGIAEDRLQLGFPYADVKIMYKEFGWSTVVIGRLVNRTRATVSRRLHDLNVQMRPVHDDPDIEKRRIENLANVRNDKDKMKQIADKIHTPDNKQRRLDAIKEKSASDPTYRRYKNPK